MEVQEECPICYVELGQVKIVTECGHSFCAVCILKARLKILYGALGCQVFFDLNTLLDAGVCATFETVKVRLEKQVMSVL